MSLHILDRVWNSTKTKSISFRLASIIVAERKKKQSVFSKQKNHLKIGCPFGYTWTFVFIIHASSNEGSHFLISGRLQFLKVLFN